MAKYEVTYSCGHSAEVELYGSKAERERKIEWFAQSGSCPDCFRAQKQDKTQTEAASLEELCKGISFSELSGTPEQIASANEIRRQVVGYFAAIKKAAGKPFDPASLQDVFNQYTDAVYWIEHRGRFGIK